jgi:hypothetical protein
LINELPDGARLCTISKEKINYFWDKLKAFDRLFSDLTQWDEVEFFRKMYSDDTILIETEGGILSLTDKCNGLYARIHASFWDHKLSTKVDMFKQCLIWAFLEYDLYRLEALIPEFSRALARFLTHKLKFQPEGRLRNRMMYNGQLCDMKMFSLLREEMI